MLVSNEAKGKTFPAFICRMRVKNHFHSNGGFDLVSLQNRSSVEQLTGKWPTDSQVSTEVIFLCRIFILFPIRIKRIMKTCQYSTTKTNSRAVYVTVKCQQK